VERRKDLLRLRDPEGRVLSKRRPTDRPAGRRCEAADGMQCDL